MLPHRTEKPDHATSFRSTFLSFKNFVRQEDTSLKVKNGQLIDRDDKLSQLDQEEISSAAQFFCLLFSFIAIF
jgi:hypothetical protein